MAICTKCGAILNDDDADKHVCDPLDIPQKGKQRIPKTTEIGIENA